jgi:hypothetical protein
MIAFEQWLGIVPAEIAFIEGRIIINAITTSIVIEGMITVVGVHGGILGVSIISLHVSSRAVIVTSLNSIAVGAVAILG